MRVALVSEGTYPYAVGGVSVWCDQLIRGFPHYGWQMIALTVDGTEQPLWDAPANLEAVHQIPLWGVASAGVGRSAGPGAAFLSPYQALVTAMLTGQDARSDRAMVARSRFLLALRGLAEYATAGADLEAAMLSNAGLARLCEAWRRAGRGELSLADALRAAGLMARMLRPLAAPPVCVDLVHASMNGLSMLPAMTAKWRYGTPVVLSEHGIYLREQYLALLQRPERYAVKVLLLSFFRALAGAGYLIADAVAPHSAYNRRWQLHNGADPGRMWTMYNGVEPAEFPVAETEPERPTVVFMGRINPLKDLHTLIRAFRLVRTRVPSGRLRIFGATPGADVDYARSCQRLIEDLDLTASVVMEGPVSSPVLAYHSASLVALTSISEGFPLTVVEAMACGRPIVATNVGGVSEAVADAGIMVPPRDPAAVAEACVRLLLNDRLRREMGRTARVRVLRRFTLVESLAAYGRVYEELAGAIGADRPPAPAPAPPIRADPQTTIVPTPATPATPPISLTSPPRLPEIESITPARSPLAPHGRARGRVPIRAGRLR